MPYTQEPKFLCLQAEIDICWLHCKFHSARSDVPTDVLKTLSFSGMLCHIDW